MGIWRQLAEYLYIKKRNPHTENSSWIKYMHGMNRMPQLFLFSLN
jgi:hypothetical protein